MAEEKTDHLIVPPTDSRLKQQLALKLQEYWQRIKGKGRPWEYMHPELAHIKFETCRDACYKAHILEAVLKSDGPVDSWELCRELRAQWNDAFNVRDFCDACGVIDKYCGNLPDQLFLAPGTGLPELPEELLEKGE